jgi:hypothetical protein
VFLYDNLGDCVNTSASRTFFYFFPVLVIIFEGYLMSLTASYQFERAVIVLLINFTLANVTLSLMLANMAKKEFTWA